MVQIFKIAFLLAFSFVTIFASSINNGHVSNSTEILIDEHQEVEQFHRIVIKPNLTDIIEKELKPHNKTFKLSKINSHSSDNLSYNLIHETENTFYLVTMVDHPSKLNVTFNYKVNPKRILKAKYDFSINRIRKESEDFNSSDVKQIEMEFRNLKFSEFLSKESKLIKFYGDNLMDDVMVLGIENRESNLLVKLGKESGFSSGTLKFKKQSCSTEDKMYKKFYEETGLELVPCSVKGSQIIPIKTTANFTSSTLDFDIDILVSNSLKININYILFLIVILLQVLFLK